MNTVKEVAVFAENKLGQLAHITRVLSEAGINIRLVTVATTDTFGVIKFLVDKPELAHQALRQSGFTVLLREVLAIGVADQPGGLHEVVALLAQHGINVENASGFVIASKQRAVLLIEVKDRERAQAVLQQGRLHLLTAAELIEI